MPSHNNSPSKSTLSLKPLNSVKYITKKTVRTISAEKISPNLIGFKAYGLTCIPKAWSLPYFCISAKLFSDFHTSPEINKRDVIEIWIKQIKKAALKIGFKESSPIIIRSSGCAEGIEERGKFHSSTGNLKKVDIALTKCLKQLSNDVELQGQKIPLLVQVYSAPPKAKGHLSNERRWCEEHRDWVIEYENFTERNIGNSSKISLRPWRKKINVEDSLKQPLFCTLSPSISETLKIPASWASSKNARIHFEWCWDGKRVVIVQGDLEENTLGVNPILIKKPNRKITNNFQPKCLKEINPEHNKYNKIKNVFIYLKLNLIDNKKLYILDDPEVIKNLALEGNTDLLIEDLKELVKDSLVIRMDVDTDDILERQLKPRTNEVRNISEAINWLKQESKEIIKTSSEKKVVFIFHNFIPAVASAFAYAAPNKRNVQIEALWGLPEGLYYNAHDKYIVDTFKPDISKINGKNIIDFSVEAKPHPKQNIIAPDKNGRWIPQRVQPSFFWHQVIKPKRWIKSIAYSSRLIAEEVGEPLSIMWFVGIPPEFCDKPFLPWYHEIFDPKIMSRSQINRKKKLFDQSYIIRTIKDLNELKNYAQRGHSYIKRIRIQPLDEELIRNKETLKTIGEIAKQINAVILLEGGILSHAYYQLLQTNAVVEIAQPFTSMEDKQEFNKLVRDKIPQKIESGGEIVVKTKLEGEQLIHALKEKLVEESLEVFDAIDQEQIIGELADVSEIIDSLLSKLNISKEELEEYQSIKREKAGGFNEGFVLYETKNPLPQSQQSDEESLFKSDDHSQKTELIRSSPKTIRRSDKREIGSAKETIMTFEFPITNDHWETDVPKTSLKMNKDLKIEIKGKIKGSRIGSQLSVTLSVHLPDIQLNLF